MHRLAFDDLLRWRRDVRHFRTDPIDTELLEKLRQRMDCAPSVGNARPWRVLQVEKPNLRENIIANFETCNSLAAESYTAGQRQSYHALKLAGLREAPVHLAVFTDTKVEEGKGLGRQTMPETLTYSTVMAIHTLWLAARAENIGMGWVSILDPAKVAATLTVPPSWSLTAYLCLGYPEKSSDTPLLHEADWQKNTRHSWQIK